MKIFIVDHSAILRRLLVECLGVLEGVEVVGQAGGASEALDAIRSLRPNVVTMDIMTPDGVSIDLLTSIKKENLAPIVVVLTNLTSPPYRKRCIGAGADFFIDKAVGINEVKRIIEGLTPRFAKNVTPPE
ncbi:MAG: response regulator transcription factor [Acidobacteria bacterium]|nr:response regulator transcription factor [Acidobacteriota bacterium]